MKRATAVLVATFACGCFYYSAQIDVAPSASASAELNESEIVQASTIVARIVTERGLVPDPQLPEIQRSSREESEWKDRVLALYWAGSEAATDDRVIVAVRVNKKTGRYRVVVRDLDSVRGNDFTASLVRSLRESLASAFPARDIRVESGTVGPALGP
jgi:hypothetical protein